jgi:hypothetical protein
MVAQRHILMKWKVDDLPSHALQADILKHCRTHNMSHRQVSGYSGKEWNNNTEYILTSNNHIISITFVHIQGRTKWP